MSRRSGGGLGAAMIAFSVVTLPLTLLFGWVGDLPHRVNPNEPAWARIGQWMSAVFHVVGASVAMVLVSPLWSFPYLLFTGVVLARHICAGAGIPLPLRLITEHVARGPLLGAAAISAAYGALGLAGIHLTPLVGAVPVVLVLGAFYTLAIEHRNYLVGQMELHSHWDEVLGQVFGVPARTFEGVHLIARDGGTMALKTPPAVANKLSDPAGIDANLARVAPDFELDPFSNHEFVVLRPATAETLQRRAFVADSGGRIVGVAGDVAPTDPQRPDDGPITINLEDL